jgi:hypothetical protein
MMRKFGEGVAATATGILVFGYGLEFMFGMLALERDTLPWLAIGFRICFQNYSICQG